MSRPQCQTAYGVRGSVLSYSGPILLDSRMTAIPLCYTKFGYVMGADGRGGNDPTKADYSTSNDAQKIFEIAAPDKTLALGLMGEIIKLPDGSFDLVAEIAKQKTRLASRSFNSLRHYVEKFGEVLKPFFDQAWQDGTLDPWEEVDPNDENDDLVARVIFAGYFNQRPSSAYLEFRHKNKKAEPQVTAIILSPGQSLLAGPGTGLIQNDPRFSEYRKPTGPHLSIEGARDLVTSRIEAYNSPLAAKLIPKCESVGAHIHVAAITPSEGFKWLTRPLVFDKSWPQTGSA